MDVRFLGDWLGFPVRDGQGGIEREREKGNHGIGDYEIICIAFYCERWPGRDREIGEYRGDNVIGDYE